MAAQRKRQSDPLDQLGKDLAKGNRPFYLFHGENRWFIDSALKLLRQKIVPVDHDDFSYVSRRLDSHSDWAEVESLLRSYSFFDETKLVHLEVPGKLDEGLRASLSAFISETPGQNVLCLTAPSLAQMQAAKNRIVKQKGLVLDFPPLDGRSLLTWAGRYMQSQGLDFERSVPELLVEALPAEPGEIASEIEKLRLMVKTGDKIRAKDVQRLVGKQRLDDVWQLAAALRPGNEAEAMKRLINLLESGHQDPVALIAPLSYTVTMLLKARLLLDEGYPPAAAADALPLWGRRAREYVDRARELSRRRLLVWLGNLQKLDVLLKRSLAERSRPLIETGILESLAGRHLRT